MASRPRDEADAATPGTSRKVRAWLVDDLLPESIGRPLRGLFEKKIAGPVLLFAFLIFVAPPLIASLAAATAIWMPPWLREPYVELVREGFALEESARSMLEESHSRLDYVQGIDFDVELGEYKPITVLLAPRQRARLKIEQVQAFTLPKAGCASREFNVPSVFAVFEASLSNAPICTIYSGTPSCETEGDLMESWWSSRGGHLSGTDVRSMVIMFQSTRPADDLARQATHCLRVKVIGRFEVFKTRYPANAA